ncbi:GNAT family N-acetyltransferase [Streptomyces boncukensis]|uniref:Lysine N-acyltransferase MbtK n=1 Tax=Streptomyces boncukensis TaxID=2711219 RepID=A0A6G4X767_9ACTN|nr:GNAT family N-acetyltransferase [Streptomyces boncukensis]NGO73365.1 acetyltransferase [Streptomyces boncukensis]
MSHPQPRSAPQAPPSSDDTLDTLDTSGQDGRADRRAGDGCDESGRDADGCDDDTLSLEVPGELTELLAERDNYDAQHEPPHGTREAAPCGTAAEPRGRHGLLDALPEWPPVRTPAGRFRLTPVQLERDLPLISAWMNDPAVAAFWELDGPHEVTAAHLRRQLEGDGRSVPCLGELDGTPMSYWEVYRADLDPLARHCRTLPHDTGLHLLIGGVAHRGRGIGTALLRSVADLVLDQRPLCRRVLAEPDVRNTPSVAAFLGAGFRFGAEVRLPDKRAALMVRDREHRAAL